MICAINMVLEELEEAKEKGIDLPRKSDEELFSPWARANKEALYASGSVDEELIDRWVEESRHYW